MADRQVCGLVGKDLQTPDLPDLPSQGETIGKFVTSGHHVAAQCICSVEKATLVCIR
jgi:hypothetical protein